MAPDQSQYTSRRSAYQALIKQVILLNRFVLFCVNSKSNIQQGASESELALMREGLVNCSAFGQNWMVGRNSSTMILNDFCAESRKHDVY